MTFIKIYAVEYLRINQVETGFSVLLQIMLKRSVFEYQNPDYRTVSDIPNVLSAGK